MTHVQGSVSLLLTICFSALAHEVTTHENIGDAALAYLQAQYPNQPFLGQSIGNARGLFRIGAVHEDTDDMTLGFLGRFFFHFTPSLESIFWEALLFQPMAAVRRYGHSLTPLARRRLGPSSQQKPIATDGTKISRQTVPARRPRIL